MATDEPIRYDQHIKPLFRSEDREMMSFVFDLWSYHDVRKNSQLILERLVDGTMPCDGEWPSEKIDLFRRWVQDGAPE